MLPDPSADVAALQAFVAVARTGAVGRAAGALGRTQPSISARLAGLEKSWGTRLFRRVSRGMALTPEGERLLPMAEAILRDLEQLDRAAGAPLAAPSELRVGAGDALGRERLPRTLGLLLREHPDLDVQVREGPRARLLESLGRGEIDVALVVGPVDDERGLDAAPLLVSPIDLLVPAGAGPAPRGPFPLRRLAGRRLVTLQPESGFRRHLERAFTAAGVAFRPAVEVGNLSLVGRFVAAGLGVGPVPSVAFAEPGGGVARRRLAGGGRVAYQRVVRRGAPLPPAMRRLFELLVEK